MEREQDNIHSTLDKLGIEKDLTPEEAAQRAAAQGGGDDDAGDDSGDNGDDNGDDSSLGAAPLIPPPVGGTALPSAEAPPALIPAPRGGRKAKTTPVSPGAAKMGKGIMDKVPGAEKVKVYRREDETGGSPGKLWFIADYTRADVNAFSDYESFLTRYVKPKYGPGEYELIGVDAYGREAALGQVRLIADPTQKGDGSLGILNTVLQQQKDRDEQWLANMKESLKQPTPQDPLALMSGMMTLQKQMNSESEAGMSQTMQMMMAMMQQNQQMMMAILSKPKEEDPTMKMLLMKLLEDKPSGAMPIPPPPPPAPTVDIPALIVALGSVMGGGGGGGDDDFKELVKAQLLAQSSDKLSTKDIVQLLTAKTEPGGEFKNAVDNMAAIMNVAQNINKNQEGGAAAGFFDALAALFSNRDFAGSIANTIRAKTDKGVSIEQQRLMAETQRIEMQRRLLANEARQLQQNSQPQQGAPATQPVAQQVVRQAPPVRVVEKSQTPTSEEVQRAAERTIARTGRLPQLPANTHEHVNNIAASKDEGELVGRTVQMLIYFAEFEEWRGFTESILGFVRDGNTAETKKYLIAFFEGLATIHLINPALGNKVVEAVMSNFDVIQTQLRELSLRGDEEVTGEDLLTPAEDGASAAIP